MKFKAFALSLSLLAVGTAAQAAPTLEEVSAVFTANNCFACHKVDQKFIGPAYLDVAKKHEGQADAAEILTKHIKEGSSGVYGPIPMPPNVGVSDEDVQTVVEWLVAGAPQ